MNNVALITGASSGIGKELAKIHASKKGDLILIARREKELELLKNELEKEYKIKVVTISKDLSKVGSAQEVYNEVKDLGIEVEYLMNNAGFGLVGEFDKLPLQRQEQMVNLNMMALTQLSHLFLQDMKKRDSGKILNTSSTVSLVPGPIQAVYFASKAYVTSFSNALSEELSNTNITVTNLMPGATKTEFGASSGMDKTLLYKGAADVKDVARDGYNAMIKGDYEIISGLALYLKVMNFFIPFMPKKCVLKIIKKMQS